MSLTVDSRRKNEKILLDHYFNAIKAAGKEIDQTELFESYVDGILYGLVVACSLPLISDEKEERVKELATVMTRRSIEALKDHNRF